MIICSKATHRAKINLRMHELWGETRLCVMEWLLFCGAKPKGSMDTFQNSLLNFIKQ